MVVLLECFRHVFMLEAVSLPHLTETVLPAFNVSHLLHIILAVRSLVSSLRSTVLKFTLCKRV